jgi:hypothetical protein
MRDAWADISGFRGVRRTIFLVSTPRIAIVMQITQQVSMLSESARGVSIIWWAPFDERGAKYADWSASWSIRGHAGWFCVDAAQIGCAVGAKRRLARAIIVPLCQPV